jgi:hypothetical protein
LQAYYKPISFIQTKHNFFFRQRSEFDLLEKIRLIWDAYTANTIKGLDDFDIFKEVNLFTKAAETNL